MQLIDVEVSAVACLAPDIRMLTLVPVGGAPLPAFSAGAHLDLHVRPGLVRQYSLCNSSADRSRYVLCVKRESNSRGGSKAVHEEVFQGMKLKVGEPRNLFPIHAVATRHRLVAGGIGITPMISMIQELRSSQSSFQLHYFCRYTQRNDMDGYLLENGIESRIAFHRGLDFQQTEAALRSILADRVEGEHLYVCGPVPFMEKVRQLAVANWPAEHLHQELFSPPFRSAGANGRFTVRLARSGGEYLVREDQTIVDALADHDIFIETSCEKGLCGTCIVDVLEGTPDHRDDVLNANDRGSNTKIVPCVSRALSNFLVLDI